MHVFLYSYTYSKIFNRNTIKLSYSCTSNMAQTIANHNKHVLADTITDDTKKMCNCRNNHECPLQGNCLVQNIIYKASVSSSDGQKYYIGSTSQSFKKRWSGHKTSFKKTQKMWSKIDMGFEANDIVHYINWEMLK